MAVKVLTLADARAANTAVTTTPETATVAADGFEVTADGDIMLLVSNVNSTTAYDITVKVGTSDNATVDYTVEIAASTVAVIKLESGKFFKTSGSSKGKYLIVPEHVDVHVKAIKY